MVTSTCHIADVAQIIGTQKTLQTEAPRVMEEKICLTVDDLSPYAVLPEIEITEEARHRKLVAHYKVPQDSLIVAQGRNGLRFGRLRTGEDGIFLDQMEFVLLKVKEEYAGKLTEEFLLQTIAQKADSLDDIATITFELIAMEQQKDEQNMQLKAIVGQLRSQSKRDIDEYKRDVHMKRHSLGQTMLNLNNWWAVLTRTRQRNGGRIDDGMVVSASNGTSVGDVLDYVGDALTVLSNKIETFTIGDDMKRTTINLAGFVREYAQANPNSLFTYIEGKGIEQKEGCRRPKTVEASFPREALTQIMNNIISNACTHGFENKAKETNHVLLTLETQGSTAALTVSNNGRPISRDLKDKEEVFLYGRTTEVGRDGHSGLGAFQIKNLMSRFDGKAEIVTDEQGEYSFGYRLTFCHCLVKE